MSATEFPVTDTSTECLHRDAQRLVAEFGDEIAILGRFGDASALRGLALVAQKAARDFGRVGASAHSAADFHVEILGAPRLKHPDDLDETPWEDE